MGPKSLVRSLFLATMRPSRCIGRSHEENCKIFENKIYKNYAQLAPTNYTQKFSGARCVKLFCVNFLHFTIFGASFIYFHLQPIVVHY